MLRQHLPLVVVALIAGWIGRKTALNEQPDASQTAPTEAADAPKQVVTSALAVRLPEGVQVDRYTRAKEVQHARGILSRPWSQDDLVAENRTLDEYHEAQSKELLRNVFMQVEQRVPMFEGATPENMANTANEYLEGWVDTMVRTAPDLAPALGEQIERQFCERQPSDLRAIMMSRIVAAMPELATESLFDCMLRSREGVEDVTSWAALDAWRSSGLPETESIRAFKESAQRSESLARFDANYGRDAADVPNAGPDQPSTPPSVAQPQSAR